MTLPVALAILALILVPFVPKLLRLRIAFFRLIHWKWAVDVHQKYFNGLVTGIRAGLCLVAAVLLYLSW